VSVEGGAAPDSEGEIYLTTVSLSRASALQALIGWLRPTVDVVKEEVVLPPDTPPEDLRQVNLQAMDGSKQAALGVAFEALGFDAIRGTGATVVQVLPEAPADGVLAAGDTIVAVGAKPVAVSSEVGERLEGLAPADVVELSVEGVDGVARTIPVTLGANPDDPERPFLGVLLDTRGFALDFPVEVTIDTQEIGGPSAGLAFTLEVLDRLTEGDLTGGMEVAATGAIGLDGRVLPIGGAAQKGAAVEDAGIELFLVPRRNLEQARRHTSDLEVVAVDTLDDALQALEAAGGEPLGDLVDGEAAA
jgi:PDZ domain-containing protein